MKVYVIADIEVTDPVLFEDYRRQVPATFEAYGGKYLVRGGKIDCLEGGPAPKRLVVVEFPSPAHARDWYASPTYQPLIALRQKSTRGRLILVEGV